MPALRIEWTKSADNRQSRADRVCSGLERGAQRSNVGEDWCSVEARSIGGSYIVLHDLAKFSH